MPEIELIVCITEGIPVLDMVRVKRALTGTKIAPDRPELPRRADARTSARSASCRAASSRRARSALSRVRARSPMKPCTRPPWSGLGQTTAVGIGGDPVNGTNFIDVLELFLADDETKSIIMIGEIGGSAEEEAAQFLKDEAKARPQEADGRLHRRPHGASGPPHGPCRRDRFGRPGRRGRQDRGDGRRRASASRPRPSELGTTLDALLKELA